MQDDMLVKYLLNEASPEEISMIRQWLDLEPANQEHFDQLKLIWETSRHLSITSTQDENAAWEKFQSRVRQPKKKASQKLGWLKIAASILLIIGTAVAVYYFPSKKTNAEQILVQAEMNVLTDTLPDGSVVTLNKRSTIEFPEDFSAATRDIKLTGEAFFSVKPDAGKPFIVSVNDVIVEVIGTSFNIRSSPDSTDIIVETGFVKVKSKTYTADLKAGERIVLYAQGREPLKETIKDQLHNYYRSREFYCEDTPLWKLVEVLNHAYDTSIIIGNDRLRNAPLNVVFYNESLEKVLEIVSLTLSLQVRKENGNIILY
jgi:ferric-dicitrate binding protein FerR (iron transport regulator)